jgi:hypothetical protein
VRISSGPHIGHRGVSFSAADLHPISRPRSPQSEAKKRVAIRIWIVGGAIIAAMLLMASIGWKWQQNAPIASIHFRKKSERLCDLPSPPTAVCLGGRALTAFTIAPS